jgi:hypothetical protein
MTTLASREKTKSFLLILNAGIRKAKNSVSCPDIAININEQTVKIKITAKTNKFEKKLSMLTIDAPDCY